MANRRWLAERVGGRGPEVSRSVPGLLVVAVLLLLPGSPARAELAVDGGETLFSLGEPVVVWGTGTPREVVTVTVAGVSREAMVEADGRWQVTWETLRGGVYQVSVESAGETASGTLVVQEEGRLPRRPLFAAMPDYVPRPGPEEDFLAFTDRWRIVPPPYELLVQGHWWDPYNQNTLKGDRPVLGEDVFLVLTGIADSLVEGRQVPTPSGISTVDTGIDFFGEPGQFFCNQNLALSAELFRGDTAFRPPAWRVKGTFVGNLNYLNVQENAVVKPDVRQGTTRTDGRGALQELFVEWKIADLSPNYDFVSVRAGIQPFSSDFRGFVYTDTNLGVRLFGNYGSNRHQYNLAWFDRLEKGTNSGLNTFEGRDQQVGVANYYRQDLPVLGWTQQLSVHYLRDQPTFHFDRNGFLVRPDPVGSFTPHEIEAVYLGWASFGHLGRLNIDHALYYVTGDDSLNPIAGPDPDVLGNDDGVDISALMAALELSYDKDWFRPKLTLFFASGDDDPTDRDAEGFDAIFDNPAFAGGGFSFWNRQGIRLPQTGVSLTSRGSLLPDLKTSKEEGQPNFVNPGLILAGLGLDVEVTPELKAVLTLNHLRFHSTETLELVLFQSDIDETIGWDGSLGLRWRPFLNNNLIVLAGVAGFLPGRGFEDIYADDEALFAGFSNLILTF